MWAAATSGTRYASQHHIQDEVHLSKVTLQFMISEASFVFIGTRTLERKRSRRMLARVCR